MKRLNDITMNLEMSVAAYVQTTDLSGVIMITTSLRYVVRLQGKELLGVNFSGINQNLMLTGRPENFWESHFTALEI
jgi:hypothetical protein